MREKIDVIQGVQPDIYANITKSAMHDDLVKAQDNCEHYAYVAFWELDDKEKKFVCIRFFIVPAPMKRMIVEADGSELF